LKRSGEQKAKLVDAMRARKDQQDAGIHFSVKKDNRSGARALDPMQIFEIFQCWDDRTAEMHTMLGHQEKLKQLKEIILKKMKGREDLGQYPQKQKQQWLEQQQQPL